MKDHGVDDPVPPLGGVLETALYVDDMARARSFYEGVMGLSAMVADDRLVAYPLGPASVLLLFKRGSTLSPVQLPGGVLPPHDGAGPLHAAIAIAGKDLERWRSRLEERGIAIVSRIEWPKGGVSLYFHDPDGHVLELATPGLWENY